MRESNFWVMRRVRLPNTTQAIKDFQKLAGLNQSGIANHETQLLLHAHVVEMNRQNPESWVVED